MSKHTTLCPACQSDWVKRKHRAVWEKLIHSNEKKYQCEHCDKVFFVVRDPIEEQRDSNE